MRRQRGRLTAREEKFAKLVAEGGHSLVGAYRLAYPPRKETRSPGAERVAARRVARRPLVEQRLEEIHDELRASDPVEMRRRANSALMRILAGRLDPQCRRTAIDVLRYLDNQERGVEKAERDALRTAMAQLALLDAIDGRGRRARLPAVRRQPGEVSRPLGTTNAGDTHPTEPNLVTQATEADAERRRAELDSVIAARRRMRFGGAM
jgi:hypothetical protein